MFLELLLCAGSRPWDTAQSRRSFYSWGAYVSKILSLLFSAYFLPSLFRALFIYSFIQYVFPTTSYVQFSSVQSLSHVRLFATLPRGLQHARPPCPSSTPSWSLLKLMSIELVMPSNHLILCRPLLLPPSIFPSIRVLSNESALHIRWPKYWSFSFSMCRVLICPFIYFTKIYCIPNVYQASLTAQLVKTPPAMQETLVVFLGQENPLEKG